MINARAAFEHADIPTTSVNATVVAIGDKFTDAEEYETTATKLIAHLVGVKVAEFENRHVARLMALRVAERLVVNKCECEDGELLVADARKYALERIANPEFSWMYTEAPRVTVAADVKQVVKGIDMKVAVKANGKIKKGGKQILAAELYKKFVLEATKAATNQEFIAILVKELDMSKSGATTYAYNCKKQLGEPAGGIVKAKKGRKAK